MKILDVPQSGSYQGVTASRNRFGQYIRTRAIPVQPNSSAQGVQRGRLAGNSAAWRTLTGAQRAGWTGLGGAISRTDSLGQAYTLQGNQAYILVNNNRQACSLAPVADAPALATPVTLLTNTLTLTAVALSLAFTATPFGAATYLFLFASPQRSAGRAFEADLRLIKVSTAAQASPLIALAEYTAKFGVPIVGNRIFFSLLTVTLGFESGPTTFSQVVV